MHTSPISLTWIITGVSTSGYLASYMRQSRLGVGEAMGDGGGLGFWEGDFRVFQEGCVNRWGR